MSTEDNDEAPQQGDAYPLADPAAWDSDPYCLPVVRIPNDAKAGELIAKLKKSDTAPLVALENFEPTAPLITDVDHIQEVATMFGLTRREAKDALLSAREKVSPLEALDFLTALRSGRPIRRKVWIATGPGTDPKQHEMLARNVWLWPQVLHRTEAPPPMQSVWLNIGTGNRAALGPEDYLATDWEVMP